MAERAGIVRSALSHGALVLGGLVVGLGVLVLVEGVLRLAGVGAGTPRRDPFAGFSTVVQMFEPATRPDGTRIFRLVPARRPPAITASGDEAEREFLAEKPPGTFRVFVVGGSSAAGVPYGTRYSFAAWLARRLEAALPEWRIEVINAGLPGYGTTRELLVVREIVAYAPDLLIVYSGHNEFVERRFYAHLVDLDPRLFRAYETIASTRLYGVLSRVLPWDPSRPPRLAYEDLNDPREMFAAVAAGEEEKAYPGQRERAYAEMLYRRNLEEMVRTMRDHGVPVLLATVSQNFADWPPAASGHRAGLAPDERTRWESLVRDGDRLAGQPEGCAAALELYGRALAVDDEYADLVYQVAACERTLAQFDAARADFRRASDLDRVPHGAPTAFNDVVRDVADRYETLFVDVDAVLTAASPHGLVGDDLFADFVHPNIRAHQLIAASLEHALAAHDVPVPRARWQTGRYTDPDPAALLAADPSLLARAHASRAASCLLARRRECASAEAKAALAIDPRFQALRMMLESADRGTLPVTLGAANDRH